MQFAVHGHTAAELIVERANSEREHMELWKNAGGHLQMLIENCRIL